MFYGTDQGFKSICFFLCEFDCIGKIAYLLRREILGLFTQPFQLCLIDLDRCFAICLKCILVYR